MKKLLKLLHDYRLKNEVSLKEMSSMLREISEHFKWMDRQTFEQQVEESWEGDK